MVSEENHPQEQGPEFAVLEMRDQPRQPPLALAGVQDWSGGPDPFETVPLFFFVFVFLCEINVVFGAQNLAVRRRFRRSRGRLRPGLPPPAHRILVSFWMTCPTKAASRPEQWQEKQFADLVQTNPSRVGSLYLVSPFVPPYTKKLRTELFVHWSMLGEFENSDRK